MFDFVYKTIPELDPAQVVTGDEMLEAVQNGKTVRIDARQLQVPGKSAYQSAVDGGFTGTEQQFNASLNRPEMLGGAVFITDITPQFADDSVTNKAHSADHFSLMVCSSTSRFVRVHVAAITGFSNYTPTITINDIQVSVTANPDAPLFSGYADIELPEFVNGDTVITAKHIDGAVWHTTVHQDTAPQITSAVFISQYPADQTELKAGDKMSIRIMTDQPVVAYEIDDSGCFVATQGQATESSVVKVYDLVVADRGSFKQFLGMRVRVQKANGAWSAWFDSAQAGDVELRDLVAVNNLFPTIVFGDVIYPDDQQAIKGGESALVNHSVLNFDSVQYLSEQLNVDAPDLYESEKAVTYQIGGYNVSDPNLTVIAKRQANGAVSTGSTVVALAQTPPSVSIRLPFTRLRSGGNAGTAAQLYPIKVVSNQALLQAPVLNLPEGQWEDPDWTPNVDKTEWSRRIRVHDDNVKGTYSFNSLLATGLAGKQQSTITGDDTYTIGGFVFRVLNVAAFPNRKADIGTVVTDTTKLRCTNLSKGQSGTLNSTYQPLITNALDHFSIVDTEGVISPTGRFWYNCDAMNATSNTSGTMQIEIEETI